VPIFNFSNSAVFVGGDTKIFLLLGAGHPSFATGISVIKYHRAVSNAAYTLNGFDDQERNLTFVKTDFQALKLKFHAEIFSRFSILFINYISRDLDNTKILLYKLFIRYMVSNLHV